MSSNTIKLIAGSSHPGLAHLISRRLNRPLANVHVNYLSNGESCVTISETLRDEDVFIIQSGGGSGEVNDHLMELLILINACKTASARRITAGSHERPSIFLDAGLFIFVVSLYSDTMFSLC